MTSPAMIERLIHLCSHELRGPVCTISGLLKLAQYHPQAIDIKDCLKKIDECNHQMEATIHIFQEFIAFESAHNSPEETSLQPTPAVGDSRQL